MKHNFVAKHMNSFNKPSVQVDKKRKDNTKRLNKSALRNME